jgi:hypothetical protein
MLKLRINQLVIWFLQVHVSNWCLSIFLVFMSKLQYTLLPPKCYELGSVPRLFTLPLFSLQTHIWVYQRAWERINNHFHNNFFSCYPPFTTFELLR